VDALDVAIRMAADDLGFIDLRPIRARAIRKCAVSPSPG
jgi:hypothetical protein